MSFADVIKNTFLKKYQSGDLSITSIAVTLGIAILLGLFIYFVYRVSTKSGFYNRDFNKSLATLPVITAAIMLAMGSNVVIGLGMVGALSIVRFRNAVKKPIDLTYLFWSISTGIVVGADLFKLAALLSFTTAALLFGLDMLPSFRTPCLLVISGESVALETEIIAVVKVYSRSVKIRSRNISKKRAEWILELQTRNEEALVQKMSELERVVSVHLMTHDGDVRF